MKKRERERVNVILHKKWNFFTIYIIQCTKIYEFKKGNYSFWKDKNR